MEIPIRCPRPANVIADETERFRPLDTASRVRQLGESTEVATSLIRHSARAAEIKAEIDEFERAWQRAQHKVFEDYERRRTPIS
jgi:hypothetical protein